MPEHEIKHLRKQTRRLAFYFGIGLGVFAGVILMTLALLRPTLEVQPTPSGALIAVDGKTIGASQRVRVLPFIRHTITASTPGFFPYDKKISLLPGQKMVLKPALAQYPEPIKLSSSALEASVSNKGVSVFYFNQSSRAFERIRVGGTVTAETISSAGLEKPDQIYWNADHSLALINRAGNASIYDFHRYDLLHQEQYKVAELIIDAAWSASNQIAVLQIQGEEVRLVRSGVNFSNQQVLTVIDGADARESTVSWSPDETVIVISSPKRVRLFPLATHEWIELAQFKGPIRFSQDGKYFLAQTQEGDVVIYDQARQITTPIAPQNSVSRVVFTDPGRVLFATDTELVERDLSNSTRGVFPVRMLTDLRAVKIVEIAHDQNANRYAVLQSGADLYTLALKRGEDDK